MFDLQQQQRMRRAADHWRTGRRQVISAEGSMGLQGPWNEEEYDYKTVYPTWEKHNEDLARFKAIAEVVGEAHPALNIMRWELADVSRWLARQGEVVC